MDIEDFESYPIAHKGKVYNVLAPFDMTFVEVRGMLDWLMAQDAFRQGGEEDPDEGRLYTCVLPEVTFEVDVHGYEVTVYARKP